MQRNCRAGQTGFRQKQRLNAYRSVLRENTYIFFSLHSIKINANNAPTSSTEEAQTYQNGSSYSAAVGPPGPDVSELAPRSLWRNYGCSACARSVFRFVRSPKVFSQFVQSFREQQDVPEFRCSTAACEGYAQVRQSIARLANGGPRNWTTFFDNLSCISLRRCMHEVDSYWKRHESFRTHFNRIRAGPSGHDDLSFGRYSS